MSDDATADAVADRLEFWRYADPEAPAIGSAGGPMLTRAELSEVMSRGRETLRGNGFGPRDRIAVLLPEGLDGALATLQVAGACTAAPVRPGLGAAGWGNILAALNPSALVVSGEWPDAASAAERRGIPVLTPAQLGRSAASASPAATAHPELLIATSGSTGPPKWVRIPQSRLVAGSGAMSRLMELTPADRSLLALPLHHALGMVSGLLLPLMSGGSVVVADRFEPERFLREVYDNEVTWFSIPPAMLRAVMEQNAVTPLPRDHRLRLVRTGTVSLPQPVIDALTNDFGVPVIEAYGMTECPHITCNPPGAPRYGSVGWPVVEELKVVGDDGRPVPTGQWGQVIIRGAPLMAGYLHPRGTAPALRDGWLQTGDEGRLDAEGYLFLRGRIGERINRGGAMVIPAEVETALLSHPDVRQTVTFGVPHPSMGHELAAAVVLGPGSNADEAELRGYLSGRLEPRQVPSRIVVVDEIPVGGAGKVVRGTLPEALEQSLYVDFEPPRNPVEDMVVDLFDAVLAGRRHPGRKIGRTSNFFLEGGDSLTAMRFMAALARRGSGEHSPTLLFDNPTPAAVAGALARSTNGNLVTLEQRGSGAPIYVVHGVTGQNFGLRHLASALGSQRPVLALQNAAFDADDVARTSVPQLAACYAEQIIAGHTGGPVHLLGFSAGGWYAHAVAAALLDLGMTVGLLALLDTYAGVPLRPAGRAARTVLRAHEGLRKLLFVGDAEARRRFAVGKAERVVLRVLALAKPDRAVAAAASSSVNWTMRDPLVRLLRNGYRPPRLPIAADIITPARRTGLLRIVWRPYCAGGVRAHALFDGHDDFIRPELMPRLADEIDRAIAEIEYRDRVGR
jgi:acyl-CoA synthetase (AMP-forming)/AMP-acid ligase II/thioesterase domain-containing protein